MGEFNTKSELWVQNKLDSWGQDVINLITRHDLSILNDLKYAPTYSSTIGTSWIDIIIHDNTDWNTMKNFKVWDDLSLNDHCLITFSTKEEMWEL